MSWHVLNVEVVLKEWISHSSSLIGISKPFREVSWVFIVEHYVNSLQFNRFLRVFPVTNISLGVDKIFGDSESSPKAEAISILPKTLCWDFSFGDTWLRSFLLSGRLVRVGIIKLQSRAHLSNFWLFDNHPVFWCSWVHFFVIIHIKRQPSTWSLAWVSEFNILYFYQNCKLI